ncbi:hypothetical protein [Serratia ureilytica]|uniref:hypothetical protein n=1 Tax=Serratia ureilytica TaxID=300181 RepID=UPI001D183CD2|nr:hypothetical protein [Serratia ureilytica]MCC4104752.1 hypothetical protein [Serratia ureilytica]
MDRTVFMTFDDFSSINTELLKSTGLSLYRSESYEHPYVRVEKIDRSSWADSGLRALSLLIGSPEDESSILGDNQIDVGRQRRVDFVSVRYGGEDEHAIGASHYGADTSRTSKLVNRELNKLLKKYAHKGVVDSAGNYNKNYYWTDAALLSGKNWHHIRHSGYPSTKPGHRPALRNSE